MASNNLSSFELQRGEINCFVWYHFHPNGLVNINRFGVVEIEEKKTHKI